MENKPIRVLIVNSYEYPFNILADSSFTLTKSIIKALPSDKFFFTWVLPEFDLPIPYKHILKGTLGIPDNVSVIQVPMLRFRPLSEMLLSEDLFFKINPVSGTRCDYDIVITNNSNVAGRISDWFASVMFKNVYDYVPLHPPIVVMDYSTPFYGNDCECSYAQYYNDKLRSMYLGYANSDAVFFFTEYCQRKAIAQFKKFFSAAECRRFIENSSVFHGVYSKQGLSVSKKKRDVFSVYWGGRIAYGKRVKVIVEAVNKAYSTGADIRMVMTLPDQKSVEVFKSSLPDSYGDIFEIHHGLSQTEAFKIMRTCHASIFAQSMRFGPAAPLEQLHSGLILLPFCKDSYDILDNTYPYYWESKEDLVAHLLEITSKYKDSVKKVKPFCNSIAMSHSLEDNIHELQDNLESLVAKQDEMFLNVVVPTMALLRGRVSEVQNKKQIGFKEYCDALMSKHRVYKPLRYELSPFYLNPSWWMLYKALRSHVSCDLLRNDPIFGRLTDDK